MVVVRKLVVIVSCLKLGSIFFLVCSGRTLSSTDYFPGCFWATLAMLMKWASHSNKDTL